MAGRPLCALSLLLGLTSVGCIPPLANRVPDTRIEMSRLVVMPVLTAAYEVDAYNKRESDEKRADSVFAAVDPEVRKETERRGAFPLPVDRINDCGKECIGLFMGLMRWGMTASMEIAAQMRGDGTIAENQLASGDYNVTTPHYSARWVRIMLCS